MRPEATTTPDPEALQRVRTMMADVGLLRRAAQANRENAARLDRQAARKEAEARTLAAGLGVDDLDRAQ